MGKFGTGHKILVTILELNGVVPPSTSDNSNGTTAGQKVDQRSYELFEGWLRNPQTKCPFPIEEHTLKYATSTLKGRLNGRPHMSTEIQRFFNDLIVQINDFRKAKLRSPTPQLTCKLELELESGLEPAHCESSLVPHTSDVTLHGGHQLTTELLNDCDTLQNKIDALGGENSFLHGENTALKADKKALLAEKKALLAEKQALLAEMLAERKALKEERNKMYLAHGREGETEEQLMRSRVQDRSFQPKRSAPTDSSEHSDSSSHKSARGSSASSPSSALPNSSCVSPDATEEEPDAAVDRSIDSPEESDELECAVAPGQELAGSQDVLSQEVDDHFGAFDSQEWHDFDVGA